MGDPVGKHKKNPLHTTLVTSVARGYNGTFYEKGDRTLLVGHKKNGDSDTADRLKPGLMLDDKLSVGSFYQLLLFASATEEEQKIFFETIQSIKDLKLPVYEEDLSNLSGSPYEKGIVSSFLVTTTNDEELSALIPIQAPFMALQKKSESLGESSELIEDYILESLAELNEVDERILKNQAVVRKMKKDAHHDLSELEKTIKELDKVSE